MLLHRDRELAAADLVMGRLSGGSPTVMMIEGGRGAGKSALLQAVLMLGPEPAVTLRARCHAAEHDFPFGVVRQLFEPVADSGRVPDGAEHDLLRGGGKDAARFQGLARQYLAQMKNAPVVADAKPAKPKEPAAPQIAKGD